MTLLVENVFPDGAAEMTLRLDSAAWWVKGEQVPIPPPETLMTMTARLTFSNTGHLLDSQDPKDADEISAALISDLAVGLANRPALPGGVYEAGYSWKQDKGIEMTHASVSVRAQSAIAAQFVRNELYRGTECGRIEYNGILTIGGVRVGTMKGTLWLAWTTGKPVRDMVERDATVYVTRPEGRVQWRIKEQETFEALN